MNNKIKIIIPVLLVSSSAFVLFQLKKEPISTSISTTSNSQNSNPINSNDQISTPTPFQILSVLSNRCIGCGKCARIDPAHFEMVGKIAKVTSSTNLTSQKLAVAINNCPGQAIVLE